MNILSWLMQWSIYNGYIKSDKTESKVQCELDGKTLERLKDWAEKVKEVEKTKPWHTDSAVIDNFDFYNWAIEQHKKTIYADWDYDCGIRIETLDNPGWSVYIYLRNTKYKNKNFEEIIINNGDNDWMFCKIENDVFKGDGDPSKLQKILETFRCWTEKNEKQSDFETKKFDESHELNWLNEWYKFNCNGDWEHGYGIKIETLDNPGWSIDINLYDTELEGQVFENIVIDKGEDDWYFCKVENNIFKGQGDPNKLMKILEIFVTWAEKYQ